MRRKREPEPIRQLDLSKLAADEKAGLESLAKAWRHMTETDRVFLMGAVAGLIAHANGGWRSEENNGI